MIAAATPMRTSVSANVVESCTTTRSQAAISPIPPAPHGTVDRRDGRSFGVHQPLERVDERPGVGRCSRNAP